MVDATQALPPSDKQTQHVDVLQNGLICGMATVATLLLIVSCLLTNNENSYNDKKPTASGRTSRCLLKTN